MLVNIRRRLNNKSPELNGDLIVSIDAKTPEDAVVEAVKKGINLDFADLSKMNLCQKDLSGIRARHASFRQAHLSGAVLMEADLRGSILDNAQLSGAHACNAIFDGASMNYASFSGADISGASFEKAKGVGVNMAMTSAARANFNDAVLPGLQAMGAEIQESTWSRAMLAGAVFVSAHARLIGLQDVIASGANFAMADLSNATLSGDFTDACFDKASLEGVRILEKTKFDGSTFNQTRGIWAEFVEQFGNKVSGLDVSNDMTPRRLMKPV